MGRVLIVDDEEDVRTLIRTNLLVKGHEVVEVEGGEAALEEVEKVTPDLVILDVMMPEMDGFQVLEKLRERPATEQIPVVMLTAKSDEADRVKGLVGGADDFVAKPFYTTELMIRIDKILNSKAASDSLRQVSITDPVTGVFNRRFFDLQIEQACDRSRRDDTDLAIYIIDIQGIHDAARKKGWRPVDRVLGQVGAWLKRNALSTEEAFWMGTHFFVIASELSGGDDARKRLDEIKKGVVSTLDANRKEIQLIPYFGVAYYDPAVPVEDFVNEAGQSPYRKGEVSTPREQKKQRESDRAETALGGKLTGLAPVAPPPLDRKKARETQEKKIPKVGKGLLAREMREVSALARDSRDDDAVVRDSTISTEAAPSSENAPEAPHETVSLGGRTELIAYLERECEAAAAGPYDLALYTVDIEGYDDAVLRAGQEAVIQALGEATAAVAGMTLAEENPFWTGRQMIVVAKGVDVPTARSRSATLTEGYASHLVPYRSQMHLSPHAGYAFYDFVETPEKLVEKAEASPFRGAVPITPLQARSRSQETPVSATGRVSAAEPAGPGDEPEEPEATHSPPDPEAMRATRVMQVPEGFAKPQSAE